MAIFPDGFSWDVFDSFSTDPKTFFSSFSQFGSDV